jgi:hypothetical protein
MSHKKRKDIVIELSKYLQNTKFEIAIQKEGKHKYIYLFDKKDNHKPINGIMDPFYTIESVYIDFHYKDFDVDTLRQYAQEIPNDQGNGDDDVSNEYIELGKLIIDFLNNC